MRNLRIAIGIYTIILTVLLVLYHLAYRGKAAESARLEKNQTALMSSIQYYQTKEGKHAASVQALTLRCNEYEALRSEQAAKIKSLGVKIKRLESIAKTVTETTVDTSALFIRDTLMLSKLKPLEMPASQLAGVIEWHDPWVSLKVRVEGDTADIHIESVDTLFQIVHRVPKRFLCIPYGTKGIRQEIVSSNPHTKIVYSEYIEFKK